MCNSLRQLSRFSVRNQRENTLIICQDRNTRIPLKFACVMHDSSALFCVSQFSENIPRKLVVHGNAFKWMQMSDDQLRPGKYSHFRACKCVVRIDAWARWPVNRRISKEKDIDSPECLSPLPPGRPAPDCSQTSNGTDTNDTVSRVTQIRVVRKIVLRHDCGRGRRRVLELLNGRLERRQVTEH